MKLRRRVKREGKVVVLFALLIPVLAGMGAFAIDVGNMEFTRSKLQAGADASALACAEDLPGPQPILEAVGLQCATLNAATGSNLQVTVEGGTWNEVTLTFTPIAQLDDATAVRVTVVKLDSELFFGSLFGKSEVDISASAVVDTSPTAGFRFLIDTELFDTDVPTIEALAAQEGVSADQLLSDANGDWFIDMPPGVEIELSTGQTGDAGLFDGDHPAFPFGKPGRPTMDAFLNYNENGGDLSKGGYDDPAVKALLDPLTGVSAFENPALYPGLVDPDFVHISPILKSDINVINANANTVKALGLRRGLVAFKIIAIGDDPDGPGGSVLPNIVIEIVNPSGIDLTDLSRFRPKLQLVQ